MPTVNTSCIQARYNEQLARLYYLAEYSPNDVLAYVLSGIELSDINIIVAADVDSLPNLQYGNPNQPDGMVYFVQSLGIIVISSNSKWLTLDGVTVRTDTVFGLTYAWGRNNNRGPLGDNTTVDKSSPVSVVGGFTDWCQVSAGGAVGGGSILALRSNGTAWGWGDNTRGKLGDNSDVEKSSPVSVVGGFCNWCNISTGYRHTVAVRATGTAWGWGCNTAGQFGDNTTLSRSSPVSVVGGFTDWCQVSAGSYFSTGVRTNGTLWTWGSATCGTLGDNTTVTKSSPVSVVGGFTDWCQVSAGRCHLLAVRQLGSIWAWGLGTCGRLGDNTIVLKSSPVSVVGGFTDWCQVSTGCLHSLAVRQNGTAWGWGSGIAGTLGDNTTVDKSSPVLVVGGFTDWCQVSAGTSAGSGVRTNGTLWNWGCNICGQLGDNTTVNKSSPVSVAGGLIGWFQVSRNAMGNPHAIGITNLE